MNTIFAGDASATLHANTEHWEKEATQMFAAVLEVRETQVPFIPSKHFVNATFFAAQLLVDWHHVEVSLPRSLRQFLIRNTSTMKLMKTFIITHDLVYFLRDLPAQTIERYGTILEPVVRKAVDAESDKQLQNRGLITNDEPSPILLRLPPNIIIGDTSYHRIDPVFMRTSNGARAELRRVLVEGGWIVDQAENIFKGHFNMRGESQNTLTMLRWRKNPTQLVVLAAYLIYGYDSERDSDFNAIVSISPPKGIVNSKHAADIPEFIVSHFNGENGEYTMKTIQDAKNRATKKKENKPQRQNSVTELRTMMATYYERIKNM